MSATATVGVDVSKAQLEVAVWWRDGRTAHQQVPNTAPGHAALTAWLQQHSAQPLPVCLEATGRYGEAVALHLHQVGHAVSVVNPAAVKHFGAALMQRHKTDKCDALVIARYAAHLHPTVWHPPRPLLAQLQDLKRLVDDLQTDRTRVKNRLEGVRAGSPARRYLEDQLAYVEQQLAAVEAELQRLRDQDDQLQQQCRLLVSIKGIGPTSALQLLAELPDLSRFTSADQLVAYAGLCPHQHHSGQQTRVSWLSKQGKAQLRKALYYPALSAKQHNPQLRRFAERLRATGKAKMVVVAAVMRKLLVLVYAILKAGQPYDPTYGLTA